MSGTAKGVRVTMVGAGGIAAAFVLLAVGVVLLVLLCVGIVLTVVYAVARHRGRRPTAVLVCGLVCIGLVIAVPAAAVTWARVTGDPETLRLDLRTPVAADSLPGDDMPGWPGYYEIRSDDLDLRLPGDRSFRSEVDSLTVVTEDGYVESVRFDSEYEPASRAVERLRGWAAQLDVAPGNVQAPPLRGRGPVRAGGRWSHTVDSGELRIHLHLNRIDGGEARAGLWIDLR